jgi:hypothetical protein
MCFLWFRLETTVVQNRMKSELGEKEREQEQEWSESSAVKEEGFG